MVVRPRPAMDCDGLRVMRAHRAPSSARHWDKRSNDDCQVNTHDGQVNAVTAASADGRRAFADGSISWCILLLFYRYCIFFIRLANSVLAMYLIHATIKYRVSPSPSPPPICFCTVRHGCRVTNAVGIIVVVFRTDLSVVAGIRCKTDGSTTILSLLFTRKPE